MKFSHSKLSLLLEDPFGYFLNYVYKVKPIKTTNALEIGSMFHWGVEHDLDDLSEYAGDGFNSLDYSLNQLIAECMLRSFLPRKQQILDKLIGEDNEILSIENEKEIEVKIPNSENTFYGIIDLLIKTKKGIIIADYKTSSKTTDPSVYLNQLLRYCYLIKQSSSEPIYRIAIINMSKPLIRRKKSETEEEFRNRIKEMYLDSDENLKVTTWEMNQSLELNDDQLKTFDCNFLDNISLAEEIINNGSFPVNYSNAITIYGPNRYYDFILLNRDLVKLNYKVEDFIFNEETGELENCRELIDYDVDNIIGDRSFIRTKAFNFCNFLNIMGDLISLSTEEMNKKKKQLLHILSTDKKLLDLYISTLAELKKDKKVFQILMDFRQKEKNKDNNLTVKDLHTLWGKIQKLKEILSDQDLSLDNFSFDEIDKMLEN